MHEKFQIQTIAPIFDLEKNWNMFCNQGSQLIHLHFETEFFAHSFAPCDRISQAKEAKIARFSTSLMPILDNPNLKYCEKSEEIGLNPPSPYLRHWNIIFILWRAPID